VDASVIEVFVNDELAFATRSFPSTGNNLIDLYAQGGTATATDLKIYNIQGGGTVSTAKNIEKKSEIIHPIVFPNPSSENFNIKFNAITEVTPVYAYIFDITGFPVKKIQKVVDANNPIIHWDGIMENGNKVIRGVYIIKGLLENELFDAKIIVE
jgi:hypothetical protein